MALLSFNNVAIQGIASAVVDNQVVNEDNYIQLFGKELLKKTIDSIGIKKRFVAPTNICTSDLCEAAAKKLLEEMVIDKATIDVLIFVSQTPDFRLPATSCLLQDRLGLSKTTAAFDVNLGCSGYVYGLSLAQMYANQDGIDRVLLLVGDTATHFISETDKSTALLFGDAGSATIMQKTGSSCKSYFTLNTDGSGFNALKIESGGYRNPSSPKTTELVLQPDGNIRSSEQLTMDGGEIFNFTIREVPKDINNLLSNAGLTIEDIDYFIYHQANSFMLNFLSKKLKLSQEKYPLSLGNFGNTSSASIPLTIVTQLRKEIMQDNKRVVMSGFGVGLSWASACIQFNKPHICGLIKIK